jgi:hypothetical protein
MVALGSKWDYAKDIIFHMLTIVWLIYGESKLIVAIFEIASEIDKPIPCLQVPIESARQSLIRDHCEWNDDVNNGSYVIPYDTWSAERVWFDFFGINMAIGFAIYSVVVLIVLMYSYCIMSTMEKEEDRHKLETFIDFFRNLYTLLISMLTLNFFFLYATVLNKLIAFGAWERVYAGQVAQGMYGEGTTAVADVSSWTDMFQPDFGAVFDFNVPERGNPLYLGLYVKGIAVFTVMTLIKNIYIVVVTAITDDMHIVSFLLNTPFALTVIAFFFVPYLAAMYCWRCIELSNAMEFNFEFDHFMKTATFGGILFGIHFQPQMFLSWMLPSILAARTTWDDYVEKLKEKEEEPGVFDLTFFHEFFLELARRSLAPVCTFVLQGTIGLSCLGWAAYEVDDEGAIESFWLLAWCTMAGALCSCALQACKRMCIAPDGAEDDVKDDAAEA